MGPLRGYENPFVTFVGYATRYGYRRLTVLLKREGWKIGAKRVYRLYDEENLKVRSV